MIQIGKTTSSASVDEPVVDGQSYLVVIYNKFNTKMTSIPSHVH